jgi:hypothetical protein
VRRVDPEGRSLLILRDRWPGGTVAQEAGKFAMSSKRIGKALMDLLRVMVESEEVLTVAPQASFLAVLAYTGRFPVPVKTCLLAAAEVAGDIDEILPATLRKYLQWRAAAQRKAEGR